MTDELDILLSEPLASVADNGFSARVMDRVQMYRHLRLAGMAASVAAGALLAVLLLPLQSIGAEFGTVIPQIAGFPAVNFAAAALILTYLFDRQFSRL
ncbi:MAG: hypothetical protein WCA81_05850 [Rhizomicrobium sp.]|jgi:protein-S-isoprenylcysteine O-methyltransferase Ste14